MNQSEVKDLLGKMDALIEEEGVSSVCSEAIMQDPIVTNRLAVELLQQIDRDTKFDAVVTPSGTQSYFGYSVALAAWVRFVPATVSEGTATLLAPLSKKEKVLVVLDSCNEEVAKALLGAVSNQGSKAISVLSLCSQGVAEVEGLPILSLL